MYLSCDNVGVKELENLEYDVEQMIQQSENDMCATNAVRALCAVLCCWWAVLCCAVLCCAVLCVL